MVLYIDDRINPRKIDFFNNFNLSLRYDSVGSTFSFSFYYNPDNAEHRDILGLSNYNLVRVEHNGELLLTGFNLNIPLVKSTSRQLVTISGYSVPGVLEDSNIPLSTYPLESLDLTLLEIAQKYCKPFKLVIDVDPSVSDKMNRKYPKITASATQSVKDFICSLASQRNIIVSHNERGHLYFTQAKADSKPIFHFEDGLIGTNMELVFNGQVFHTPISVIKQADSEGGNAAEITIDNPYVPASTQAFRPKVVIQNSGDDISTELCAKNVLAQELKEGIKLKITIDRWLLNDNKIIKPNQVVSVLSPENGIFKKTNFFIEAVDFVGNESTNAATLHCVVPEVYNGKTPKNIFTK